MRNPSDHNTKQSYSDREMVLTNRTTQLSENKQRKFITAKNDIWREFFSDNSSSGNSKKLLLFSNQPRASDNRKNIQKSLINKVKIDFLQIWSISIFRFSQLREFFLKNLASKIGQPGYGLIAGMVFGDNAELDKVLRHNLRIIGMLHLTSASGYNISLVVMLIQPLLKNVYSSRWRFFVLFLFVWLYALTSGGSISIVRSSMASCLLLGLRHIFYHRTSPLVIIFWIFYLLVVMNPSFLTNISFQLSFLASFGLVYTFSFTNFNYSAVNPTFSGLPFKNVVDVLIDSFRTTLVAQLFVLPVVLANFNELSVVALLSNTLLLWLTPIITISGALLILIANLPWFDVFSRPLAWCISWPVMLFEKSAQFFANWPWSMIDFDREIRVLDIFIYYLLLLIAIRSLTRSDVNHSVFVICCSKVIKKWRN
ncbi:MAG: ComEC/Rec2 family competence protein [Patescibacteria group bacterium]